MQDVNPQSSTFLFLNLARDVNGRTTICNSIGEYPNGGSFIIALSRVPDVPFVTRSELFNSLDNDRQSILLMLACMWKLV